jgi:hypothetical protein
MRRRSAVLSAVLAVAAASVPAGPASARAQCGLVMPAAVVVDAPTVQTDVTLTSGCYANEADHAFWDLIHPGSGGFRRPVDFESAEIAEGPHGHQQWSDIEPMGNWYLEPFGAETADGSDLTQNAAITRVKYASRLSTTVTRSTTGALSWSVRATQWSGRAHAYVGRSRVTVGLFRRPPGTTTWKYVTSVTTSRTGRSTVAVERPGEGSYRLVVGETPSVWPSYSRAIRGRI